MKEARLFVRPRIVKRTSLRRAIYSVVKAAAGPGILSLPVAFAQVGLVPGLCMLVLSSALKTSTLHFMSRLAANTDLDDYFGIGRLAFGLAGKISTIVLLILFQVGVLTFIPSKAAYLMVHLYSSATALAAPAQACSAPREAAPLGPTALAMAVFYAAVLPLSLVRGQKWHGTVELLSLCVVFYVLAITAAEFLLVPLLPPIDFWSSPALTVEGAFVAFSNIIYTFVSHFALISVVPGLRSPSGRRRSLLTIVSALWTLALYMVTAVLGYLRFGRDGFKGPPPLQGGAGPGSPALIYDLITAPGTQPAMRPAYCLAQLLCVSLLVATFPVILSEVRTYVEKLIYKLSGHKMTNAGMLSASNAALTLALSGVPTLVALCFASDLSSILGIVMSLFGSTLILILPSVFLLRLCRKMRVRRREFLMADFCLLSGVILLVGGTYFNIGALLAGRPPSA